MSPFRLIDYHMHTAVTVDGKMTELEACEQALALGIPEIAFTNHVMLKQPKYLMTPEAFTAHWERVQDCQARFPMLTIRLGIEMDYYPGWEERVAASLSAYERLISRPFDLVLGAIHELREVFFSNQGQAPRLYAGADLPQLYRDYFEVATRAVRSRLYDVIAHPDLIKKFTHELAPPLPFEQYRAAAGDFVDALLEEGVGMDVNTKGLKLRVQEAYPSPELLGLYLERARERGCTPILTLGSDAHIPEDVGGLLPEAAGWLQTLGETRLTRFSAHQPAPYDFTSGIRL